MYRLYLILHSKSVDVTGICKCMCVYTAYDHSDPYMGMQRLSPTLRVPIEAVLVGTAKYSSRPARAPRPLTNHCCYY